MQIADNVIKHHLQNVYFVSGGACGGKTTITKYLAQKYDMVLYNWDEHFPEYQQLADPVYQPALSQRAAMALDWEEYFMRPAEQFSDWIGATFEEQTGMVVADLIRVSAMVANKKVIVDGFFGPHELQRISDYSRVFFLLATETVIRHDYFRREDKQDMLNCIMGLKHPEAAIENVFGSMFYKADEHDKQILESGFEYYVREALGGGPSEVIAEVETHFGLV